MAEYLDQELITFAGQHTIRQVIVSAAAGSFLLEVRDGTVVGSPFVEIPDSALAVSGVYDYRHHSEYEYRITLTGDARAFVSSRAH